MNRSNKAAVTILSHQAGDNMKFTAIKSIIIDALFYANTPLTRDSLFKQIESLFGVLIHSKQFLNSIDCLIDEKVVIENSLEQLLLSDFIYAEMQAKMLEENSCRNKAISEWAEKNNISLTENSDEIFALVDKFVRSVFIRHGAISYSLITGRQSFEHFAIEEIEKEILASCDSIIVESVRDNLSKILSYPFSENTLHYLRNNAKKATSYLSSIMPREYVTSLEERLKNLSLYLDTNVVYRLLGLQGDERFITVDNVIKFCLERGVNIRVSAETYKELSKTIAKDAQIILNYPTRSSLAAAGYRLRSADNYVSVFWNETAKTGVLARDFNEIYRNADLLLKAKGIDVETVLVDTDSLIETAKSNYDKLSRTEGKKDATYDVIWHDAYNIDSTAITPV